MKSTNFLFSLNMLSNYICRESRRLISKFETRQPRTSRRNVSWNKHVVSWVSKPRASRIVANAFLQAISYIKREILINKDLLIYRQAKIKDGIERLSVVVMTPLSSLEKAYYSQLESDRVWWRSWDPARSAKTKYIHHKGKKPLKSLLKITH